MKLLYKIVFLSVGVFAVCAVLFGLLHNQVKQKEAHFGYVQKASSAAISAANFALSDMEFVSSDNLKKAAEAASLTSLEVFVEPKMDLGNIDNPTIIMYDNYDLSAQYILQTENNNIRAVAKLYESKLSNYNKYFYINMSIWLASGITVGLVAALIIAFVIRKRIDNVKLLKSGNNLIHIEEFEDFANTAALLKQINDNKTLFECKSLNNLSLNSSLEETLLQKIMPPMDFQINGYYVNLNFAHSKCDASFYRKISDNKILYGAIKDKANSIESMSSAFLAALVSEKLLKTLPVQEAYNNLKKSFNFKQWNLIEIKADKIERIGFYNGSWGEESFKDKTPILFTTADMGMAVSFYSRLDLANGKDKMDTIMNLSPENEGGLFIFIEKVINEK